MTKQAFCKCGGVVVRILGTSCIGYTTLIDDHDPTDWDIGDEIDDPQVPLWFYESMGWVEDGFHCQQCHADLDDLASALKDGRIVLRENQTC